MQNDVIEGLRVALHNLQKDLYDERDFRKEDISELFTRLTGSSEQVVRPVEEPVSKIQDGSCECGAIVSQYENLMMAFKKEKNENIMLRKEFHEIRKQHDFENGNASEKFNNMVSRLNSAEKTLRSEINTIKYETIAEFHEMRQQHDFEIGNVSEKLINMDSRFNNSEETLRSEINTIKYETISEFQEMRKLQDFKIGNVSEKCFKVESRFNYAEKTLRSDIDTINKETMAVNRRYSVCQKDINNTRSYFNDVIIHLNESLMNRSLNTLQEISRITSDTAKLKTSNEILKNITDNLFRHQRFFPHKSCDNVIESGEYTIYPDAFSHGLKVYCHFDSTNKGWIVIQRRKDGSEDFNRTWADYKAGFGDLSGEFWLGNDHVYQLTKDKPRQLRIDMGMFNGTKRYALYSEFKISSESDKYKLHLSGYTGDAEDCLSTDCYGGYNLHNGRSFSTFDRDNDLSSVCCACVWGGGWWFDRCFSVHLNGRYFKEKDNVSVYEGIQWFKITGWNTSLKFVQMSMR
ncbi:hypothetical protein DPMN_185024 [Dreissena polymorpha]|uniref:Fibrinogen C-terminal domain-containing protein n=1 Tax=Dreissena polymorpha TaxID=45954 RepID=A0A9D4DKB0_DREPO|nr:hypothetical protein DPMN_185024 [Dreissena polymorpha]